MCEFSLTDELVELVVSRRDQLTAAGLEAARRTDALKHGRLSGASRWVGGSSERGGTEEEIDIASKPAIPPPPDAPNGGESA